MSVAAGGRRPGASSGRPRWRRAIVRAVCLVGVLVATASCVSTGLHGRSALRACVTCLSFEHGRIVRDTTADDAEWRWVQTDRSPSSLYTDLLHLAAHEHCWISADAHATSVVDELISTGDGLWHLSALALELEHNADARARLLEAVRRDAVSVREIDAALLADTLRFRKDPEISEADRAAIRRIETLGGVDPLAPYRLR